MSILSVVNTLSKCLRSAYAFAMLEVQTLPSDNKVGIPVDSDLKNFN